MAKKKEDSTTITPKEAEALIDRLHKTDLSATDKSTLSKIIRGYIYVSDLVTETGMRLKNIREFFFPKNKKKKKTQNKSSQSSEPEPEFSSYTDDLNKPLTDTPSEETRKRTQKTNTQHGRLPVDEYVGAEHENCYHETLNVGDTCPECGRGKLYPFKKKKQIQLYGGAPVKATCFHVEVLRCASCLTIFNARENTGKYQYSAKSIIAISRYYMGLPFHRLEQFQKMVGIPLADSTQYDLSQQLFGDARPVYNYLIKSAAQSGLFHHDDTSCRILSLIQENKNRKKGMRYGTHSTGIVAVGDEHTIVLYFTGRCHSGENMGKLLDLREDGLAKPIQMSDAASLNHPKGHDDETIEAYCNAHGVRKFKDLESHFSELCVNVLVAMGAVFEHDEYCKANNVTGDRRMQYHQEHSAPIMTALKSWMNVQLNEHLVEENNGLGRAMRYLLKHWKKLTRFLTVPNAPLDNNVAERALKKLISQRKNSLFFANEYSAYVGCALTSLIVTCEVAGINAFDYLNCLQENRFYVARNPENWLPWNYEQQVLTRNFTPVIRQSSMNRVSVPEQNL